MDMEKKDASRILSLDKKLEQTILKLVGDSDVVAKIQEEIMAMGYENSIQLTIELKIEKATPKNRRKGGSHGRNGQK